MKWGWTIRWYGPERVLIADDAETPQEVPLAEGIVGFKVEHDGHTYIPWFQAKPEGQGHGGRFLNSLPSGTRIPNLLTERLESMLIRRRWESHIEWAKGAGWHGIDEAVEVWEKP